ncbi:hypothetical protein I552_10222 [Mycobacterium xenopi 3993]|nr:hypothetical protein I552_10222 [Mycobacterium xenopi 3993]
MSALIGAIASRCWPVWCGGWASARPPRRLRQAEAAVADAEAHAGKWCLRTGRRSPTVCKPVGCRGDTVGGTETRLEAAEQRPRGRAACQLGGDTVQGGCAVPAADRGLVQPAVPGEQLPPPPDELAGVL